MNVYIFYYILNFMCRVDHVEPWLSGNARGPSTAFCLLFRLGQLRPEPAVIREMLENRDSPYIRAVSDTILSDSRLKGLCVPYAILGVSYPRVLRGAYSFSIFLMQVGFLYLRYCCNPRELWKWFKKYVQDEEEFAPSPGALGRRITIGEFARDILLDQFYFETIFPRIPKVVSEDIRSSLKSMALPTEPAGNAGQGGPSRRGVEGGSRRPASVKSSLSVALGQRAPNRSGAREEGRGLGAEIHLDRQDKRNNNYRRRSRSPSRPRERSFSIKDKYDKYDRYDKYDKYDRYDRYDKYDDRYEVARERSHGEFAHGDFQRVSHSRSGEERYRDNTHSHETNRFSSGARREERSRTAETGPQRRDARDVFKERPASFRGRISGY